jgi:hypothetical protein
MRFRVRGGVIRRVSAPLALLLAALVAAPAAADSPVIQVLSNRADLLSGGDALVEIAGAGKNAAIDVDGRDVSTEFTPQPGGRSSDS